MMPFRNYSEHEYRDGLPVVSVVSQPDSPSLHDHSHRAEVNGQLAEVTDTTYRWPLAGMEAIADVLHEYGMTLPDIQFDDEVSDEVVFLIKDHHEIEDPEHPPSPDLFLYIFYSPTNNDSQLEFYAEVVNEKELEELLDELNEKDDDIDDDARLE